MGRVLHEVQLASTRVTVLRSEEMEMYGVVEAPGLIPHSDIDRYVDEYWHKHYVFNDEHRRRTDTDQTYLEHTQILDLLLHDKIVDLFTEIGVVVAVHSDLTYWRSANTGWHVDILHGNVETVTQYMGVWIALDDIDPETGPFQWLPGSHKWPLDMSGPSDGIDMNHICQQAMRDNEYEISTFLPKKGDVLVWNGRVIHRGSAPKVNRPRPALLGHFSNQWSAGGGVPSMSEVEEMMNVDPSMLRHGKGWYKTMDGRHPGGDDYDEMLLSYSESGTLLT